MKKLVFLLTAVVCSIGLNAQVAFTSLQLTPAAPKPNSSLSFAYDKTNTTLEGKADIDIVVYLFNEDGYKVAEPVISKKGNTYSGSVQPGADCRMIAFMISSGDTKDNNKGKGYVTPVYGENNMPVKGYYSSAADFQAFYGQQILGLNSNAAEAQRLLEEGAKQFPELKKDPVYFNKYISSLEKSKAKNAATLIDDEMAAFEKSAPLSEAGYGVLIQIAKRNKKSAKADSLSAVMKTAFPNGEWKKTDQLTAFNAEKSAAKKAELYNTFAAAYPQNEKDMNMHNFMKSQIANAYAKEKNYSAYHEWNNKLEKAAAASNNNNLAWNMAESDENIQEAKKMAEAATLYAKSEMEHPTGKQPATLTTKQWNEQRRANYAMYGDTYAFVLYKLGDYATAFPYAKDASGINEQKDADLNERYALLAEKVLPAADATTLIEGFVKNNAASTKSTEVLKNLYIAEHKGEAGFDAYMAKLRETAKANRKAEIAAGILNEEAPKFSLKDFEGKTVSLDDLKGKIVIVDFWATWCGPCIRSMPGMNKALAKYESNPNVKFLFVDTWETAEDKLKNAKSFMEKKKYPFHVLMDDENKMVEDFMVSGIPTKFIIDKQGKIRFKAVGFNGGDDELVDELDTMIELASK
ncbi:MAG: redoxin domain-containing protein [Bacteroidetes bacterium]|nr:redoxin domain-containing protein [Bacteroidota bacterium]